LEKVCSEASEEDPCSVDALSFDPLKAQRRDLLEPTCVPRSNLSISLGWEVKAPTAVEKEPPALYHQNAGLGAGLLFE
jgi:hypothetical protein